MQREPNYLALGATVAVILTLFFGVVLFIAGTGQWGKAYQKVTIRFPHTLPLPTLKAGSQVVCGGTPAGTVRSVELRNIQADPKSDRRDLFVVVEAEIDAALDLRKDCQVRAEGPPLGGQGRLIVVNRGTSPEALTEDDVIEGLPPTGLGAVVQNLGDRLAEELDDKNTESLLYKIKSQLDAEVPASLLAKIHGIADDLKATTDRIRTELEPAEQEALLAKLHAALSDVRAVTAALRKEADAQNPSALLGGVHTLLAALQQASQSAAAVLQENRPTVRSALANIQAATSSIRERLIPSVVAQVDVNEEASLMAKFHAAADRTNAALQNVNEMTATARNLLAVNRDSLDQTVQNLRETSEHLRAASREIRRSPWRLLYQPSAEELERTRVVEAARMFSDAAARLDDAFGRLKAYVQAAGPALAPDDPQLRQLQEHLKLAFEKLTAAEKHFWEKFASR